MLPEEKRRSIARQVLGDLRGDFDAIENGVGRIGATRPPFMPISRRRARDAASA